MTDTPTGSCIVLDPDGNPWGPFADEKAAATWAEKKWPYIPQCFDEIEGGPFWQVMAMRSPGGV